MDTPAMHKATVGSGIKKKKKSAQHYVKSITRAAIEQGKSDKRKIDADTTGWENLY